MSQPASVTRKPTAPTLKPSLPHLISKAKIRSFFKQNRANFTTEMPQETLTNLAIYEVEHATYEREKPRLLQAFPGQYVVLVGKEMIGPFEDFTMAHRSARRRFGLGKLYIKQILEKEPRVESTAVEVCRF